MFRKLKQNPIAALFSTTVKQTTLFCPELFGLAREVLKPQDFVQARSRGQRLQRQNCTSIPASLRRDNFVHACRI